MDIVVLAVTLIAALLLDRPRALAVGGVAWVAGLLMVAVGPAHNADVHLGTAGFWVPWTILLAIVVGLVLLVTGVRRRRAPAAPARS